MNLDFGVEYKLTQEFRTLGANLVISPGRAAQSIDAGTASPVLMGQDTVMRAIETDARAGAGCRGTVSIHRRASWGDTGRCCGYVAR